MQIRISECFNNPPLISKLENECVIAGTLIQKNISATDVDVTNTIKLSAFGGPFVQKIVQRLPIQQLQMEIQRVFYLIGNQRVLP